jgi:serine phosphatase RsbU (regulator of sigma subunit)
MFPEPIDGDIRLEYTYDPLLGIGGDFLHVHQHAPSGRVTLTILDVSGHGLAAALTVNRLFGELERICAEHPDQVTPSLLMAGLNRYVHLVMAKHSLYATSACIQMDPGTGQLHWVVSGHPPPLLRRRNGTVEDLECTSVILGALDPEMFDPNEQTKALALGDVVVVYTDGTFESRNASGEFFGLARLRETLAFDTPPRDWSRFVTSTVERFRGKHSGRSQSVEDDLLVASIALSAHRRVVEINSKSPDAPDPLAQEDELGVAAKPSPTADPNPPR